jgi:hypothetical protein
MNCGWYLWFNHLCKGFRNRPFCLKCDLSFLYLGFPLLSALFRVILLIVLVTQFTASLHAGSWVSCHNFLSHCLCFSRWSRADGPQFQSETVVGLDNCLHAVSIEAAKLCAALSASIHELILILGDTKSDARLWNCFQTVWIFQLHQKLL